MRVLLKKTITTCILAVSAAAFSAEKLDFLFLDTEGLSARSTLKKKNAVLFQISDSGADVVLLSSLGDRKVLDALTEKTEMIFAKFADSKKGGHLGLMSRIVPESVKIYSNMNYTIKEDVKLPVLRGFLHAVFEKDGYRLHMLGAHLKDRTTHPEYNQTDMRRYEARELRYLATEIIKNEENPNILVLANLNDTCGKSPVKAVYNRRFGVKKRLFDLRPLDSFGTSWTCWNAEIDAYERIDYAIASSPLLPEIDHTNCRIAENRPDKASKHRPLIVRVLCEDKALWTEEKIKELYPYAIYSRPAAIGKN